MATEQLTSTPSSVEAEKERDSHDGLRGAAEHSQSENNGLKTDGVVEEAVKFEPSYRFYLAFSSLAVLAMMVSLDGTSVSVALPVCAFFKLLAAPFRTDLLWLTGRR